MTHDDTERLSAEAEELNHQGLFEAAEARCRDALASIPAGVDHPQHAHILNVLVNTMWRCGRIAEAAPIAMQAAEIGARRQAHDDVAESLNLLGTLYEELGDSARAIDSYEQALATFIDLNDQRMAGGTLVNIGALYFGLGDNARALEYYQRAVGIFSEIGERKFRAIAEGNLGSVYQSLLDRTNAIEHYTRAISAFQELDMPAEVGIFTMSLATVFGDEDDYDRALETFEEAHTLFERLGMSALAADTTASIGQVFARMGRHEKALEHYHGAVAAFRACGNHVKAAYWTGKIGAVYADRTYHGYDAKTAEQHLLTSVSAHASSGAKTPLFQAHAMLAQLYKQEQRWEDAVRHTERAYTLKEEVRSDEAAAESRRMEHRRKIEDAERDRQVKLARFQEQEKILHNILPMQIADRILSGEKRIADAYHGATVFFSDIVGFTQLSQRITADELVALLNDLFVEFDKLARQHGLEKIKTIGDSYMAVAGVPTVQDDHAQRALHFALDVVRMMHAFRERTKHDIHVRIGLHSGTVVAGVIGEDKFAYDLWGDTVNIASRMESHGEAGRVHVSEALVEALAHHADHVRITPRGEIDVKGKGRMQTFFVDPA